ncbi:MAG: hypothetical protein NZT92_10430 [Abditibacteriales bacterium]|nr:hypothetical protein [Abditibacteriales bacterium]MDW8366607.1 hypothetical protein [Abditibacteriales bacterium]
MTKHAHQLTAGLVMLMAFKVGWSQARHYHIACSGAAAGGAFNGQR